MTENTYAFLHKCSANDITQFPMKCLCVFDPDPASFSPRLNDNPADLLPPELPPKGIRRRQPPSKVKLFIFSFFLYL